MRISSVQRLARRALMGVVVSVLLMTAVAPAAAAPSASARIAQARAEASAARERLDELAADMEERSEEYLAIEDELARTRKRIRVAEEELAVTIKELEAAEAQLNDRAVSIYRGGSVDVISVFVGVTDFRDLVTRLDLLQRVGRNDAALVVSVKSARTKLSRTRSRLENRREEQVVLLRRARDKRREVELAVVAQQLYLDGLDRRVKRLMAEERARQVAVAKERARKAAAAARAKARAAQRPAVGRSASGPLGAAHPEALAVARRFIGVTPYLWGGTTPEGFDCSGLTQYCYREIGIELPRTSRQQYRVGSAIPADRLDLLQPGDLVFFAREADPARIHHVGIYSGGGRYVHAPQTGMRVSESSLIERIERRGDYVGAVRP